jgi:putative ABC transport system permease protein
LNTLQSDALTVDDMNSVRNEVPGISAASPMLEMHSRITISGGKERDVLILGVSPEYSTIRNLIVTQGRFFDTQDSQARDKVALVTPTLATKLYGSPSAAAGQTISLEKLAFTIIGTFKERVDTYGQSEVAEDTILIPYTVGRYFTETDAVKQIMFSMSDASMVPMATQEIKQVLQSRHRPESVYHVENLTQILTVANQTANALTLVLLMIATVTLLVSGVGIMNIMLANVRARIREIGIRKAVGATRREIKLQFLTEAILISLAGGTVGIVIGLAVPISVRLFSDYHIPISGLSVLIAVLVASLVGIIFGTLPATRAAQMDPVEALHFD